MLRNALLTAVGLALIGLSRLGFNAVALNVFGEQLSGQLNVALSLGVLLSLPASTALGATVIRYIALARGQGRWDTVGWIYRTTLGATMIIAAISAALALAFRERLSWSQHIDTGLVAQAVVVALGYVSYLFFRNVLYALDRVQVYAVFEIVCGVAFCSVLTGLSVLGHGRYLLAAFVLGHTTFTLLTIFQTRSSLVARCDNTRRLSALPLVKYSVLAFVGTAASLCVRELAVAFAPSADGFGGAAHLALSMSLLAPLQFLPRMFRTVLFAHSALLDGQGERHKLTQSINAATHWLLLATLPACSVLVLAAAPVLTLLGGTATPDRLLVFRLLTGAALIDIIATPSANILPGIGVVRAPSYAALVALGVTLALWGGLVPHHGLTALAIGMVASSLIKGGVPIYAARRLLGARLTHTPVVPLALVAATAAGIWLLAWWPHPILVALIYVGVATPLLWREARQLAREIARRWRHRMPCS